MSLDDFTTTVWPSAVAPLSTGDVSSLALLVIDVQNDFISGSLAVDGADEVVGPINRVLAASGADLAAVCYSQDWHPPDHVSFFSNVGLRKRVRPEEEAEMFGTVTFSGPPAFNQTLWPDHCVQGTEGAIFHPNMTVRDDKTVERRQDHSVCVERHDQWSSDATQKHDCPLP